MRGGARTGRPETSGVQAGYYGRPALKPPVWTWEIPLYFFVGGIAGGSGILAFAAHGVGQETLARGALWTALFGVIASAALLVSDLGRPGRFLHMLRVFKWRSAMSVGAWVLAAYGAAVAASLALLPSEGEGARWLLRAGLAVCALGGALLSTYTGVLLGVTAVPAWQTHRGVLPVHFGVAGLGSAAAVLRLLGHASPALPLLGMGAAAAETLIGGWIELRRAEPRDRALRRGRAGLLLRTSAVLAGPLALGLGWGGLAGAAAVAFLAGSLLSRFGWIEAGRTSALDPEAALGSRG